MYSIGQVARKYGLARSTLLYYESIGILKASGRGSNNYRHYTDIDCLRLEQICMYRQAGLPLREINDLLNGTSSDPCAILAGQFNDLARDIQRLRFQQQLIIAIMQKLRLTAEGEPFDSESWLRLLEEAGLDSGQRMHWHRYFETTAPDQHHMFLRSLGLNDEEIRKIRRIVRAAESS